MTSTFHVILVGGPSTAAVDGPARLVAVADHLQRDSPPFLISNLARFPLFQIQVEYVTMMPVRLHSSTVIDVLEGFIEGSGERGATSQSVMAQLETSFVVHFCIFKKNVIFCVDSYLDHFV